MQRRSSGGTSGHRVRCPGGTECELIRHQEGEAEGQTLQARRSVGVYLYIMPSEYRGWRMKFRFVGKEKRRVFGSYRTSRAARWRSTFSTVMNELAGVESRVGIARSSTSCWHTCRATASRPRTTALNTCRVGASWRRNGRTMLVQDLAPLHSLLTRLRQHGRPVREQWHDRALPHQDRRRQSLEGPSDRTAGAPQQLPRRRPRSAATLCARL